MTGRGRLQPGAPAELALCDRERPWRLGPAQFLSRPKNSSFDGHLVQGKVLRTAVDGRSKFVAEDQGFTAMRQE